MNIKPIIKIQDLYKSFEVGKEKVDVLKGIDIEIFSGEFVVIFGPSGCGKSTLLNSIVGLEKPTSGRVQIKGRDLYALTQDKRANFRSKRFGIVHQQPSWLKSLNVLENVALPIMIRGGKEKTSLKRAHNLLELFRLEEFENNKPTELSGGQQQRVAVVRSLVTNPGVIIADEPTGNLDTVSASDLMYVFQYLNMELKRTIIMVTHNPDYDKYATKIITMEDGQVKSVKVKKKVQLDESEEISDIVPDEKGEERVTENA